MNLCQAAPAPRHPLSFLFVFFRIFSFFSFFPCPPRVPRVPVSFSSHLFALPSLYQPFTPLFAKLFCNKRASLLHTSSLSCTFAHENERPSPVQGDVSTHRSARAYATRRQNVRAHREEYEYAKRVGPMATESTKGILCVGNKKSGVSFCDSLGLHYFCAQNKP